MSACTKRTIFVLKYGRGQGDSAQKAFRSSILTMAHAHSRGGSGRGGATERSQNNQSVAEFVESPRVGESLDWRCLLTRRCV
jgi:hypothetical protein